MRYDSDLTNLPQGRSLLALKQEFASRDYDLSYISERQLSGQSENAIEEIDQRLTITQAFVITYRQWVEEWLKGWKNECFASLPVLSISDEWLKQGNGIPIINTVLAGEGTLYEPGDHVLACQSHELPEVLNQIRWLNLSVGRDDKNNEWVIWDYDAVNTTLNEIVIHCSYLPKIEHTFFLLNLLHNTNLCAQQFCPLTRDIVQLETDTRIGALSSMLAVVIDCLTNIHLEKNYDLSDVIKELIGIAHFSDCNYILFDSVQWSVT